jgi:hypothetical protein
MSQENDGRPLPQMTMDELFALPVSFSLMTAARALGLGKSSAYEMAAAGTFPCPVQRYGGQYRVSRPNLFRALGLDPAAVAARIEDQAPGAVAARYPSRDIGSVFYDAVMAAARVLIERHDLSP